MNETGNTVLSTIICVIVGGEEKRRGDLSGIIAQV